MQLFSTLSLVTVIIASGSSAFAAGGLLLTLPKDGTWTKYNVEMKSEKPAQEMSGTFTLRSVGSVTENGEKCRWIEMQMEGERNGKKQGGIFKILVKEKGFKSGSEIIRGWTQNNSGDEIKELTDKEKSSDGMMAMFIGGNRRDVKKLKSEKVIDYQKGQLKIATGTTGTMQLNPSPNAPANANILITVTQAIWPHEKVPFGTATMKLNLEIKIKDMVVSKGMMTFTVQDYGTGGKEAKSVWPEKK